MRVLMLSWEYPPLVVGGLGTHVEGLARQLASAGHDVRVVTRGESGERVDEVLDTVRVTRAAVDPIAVDFTTESLLAWAQVREHALLRAALPVVRGWRPEVIHAHDWLVAQTAITLAEHTGAPLVATLHATEHGRHQGWLPSPLSRAIHSVEAWLASRSDAVITCSTSARDEVVALFGIPIDDVAVVPNAIDADRWRVTTRGRAAARRQHADEPLVVFAGRLTHEKGVQTLLEAIRPLRGSYPTLRVVIAGTGSHEQELRALARRLRVSRAVTWPGFLSPDDLRTLFAAADAVVVPSLYEPFGLVALEAAATGASVVVARSDGLCDLARTGVATASFPAEDATALAVAVDELLRDPQGAKRASGRARHIVRHDYTWAPVAAQTIEIYRRAAAGRSER